MFSAVIMAGGSGTRFWPASRALRPKQLLDLTGDGSMLQNTVRRLSGLCSDDQLLIMTNEKLVDAIQQQLPQLPAGAIVGEPFKRDTAPCIGWAAHLVRHRNPDGVMVVMPSDHVIQPTSAFQDAMKFACELVEQDPKRIVTFGIPPTYAASTFGYIERQQWLAANEGESLRAATVECFREKPKRDVAETYLASGKHYWNSGIFVWKASTIIEAIERFEPEMGERLAKIGAAIGTDREDTVLREEFEAIEGKSIDYAVMERYADEICVIEAPFKWDDLGGWQASARQVGADDEGNSRVGKTLAVRTGGSILRTNDDHLVVTLGMQNCIVVHTPDATLVANQDDEEAIREVVQALKEMGHDIHL